MKILHDLLVEIKFNSQFSPTFIRIKMVPGKELISLIFSTFCFNAVFSYVPLKTCRGNNGALKYGVGKSYVYAYSSASSVQIRYWELNSVPRITVNGNVVLTPLSDCEFVLSIHDTSITVQSFRDSDEVVPVDMSSIRFYMEEGVVEEVFIDPKESSWTVNIKKSIVSLIMNQRFSDTIDKTILQETGIHGKCPTHFSQSENTFTRVVDLSECSEGEGSSIISHGVPYQVPLVKNKKIFQVFGSRTMKCEQKLEGGIIEVGSCQLQPNQPVFNSFDYEMEAQLTFRSTMDTASTPEEEIQKLDMPSNIMYNFTQTMSHIMEVNAEAQILSLLKSLESNEWRRGKIFIDLKKAISRASNLPHLQIDEVQRKVFYDAVAEVTTDQGIQLLADLIREGSLDTTTQQTFYTNIAFATNPGTKALVALKDLVMSISLKAGENIGDRKELEQNVTLGQLLLLGSSGLAHQYCQLANTNCASVPEYIALVNEIAKHAREDVHEGMVRGALYALGNLDVLTSESVAILEVILTQDNSASSWKNFLVLEAFRRDPCQPSLKEAVRAWLSDSDKTDELRMHAYLAVSKCLQPLDIEVISSILAQDSSSVGGFIGSHLRNMVDSSSPSKEAFKSSLSRIQVPENVLSVHDQPRASKFVEHSTFKGKNNLGFSVDSTLIFAPGIPKPRFLSMNATIDLFGRSFNFLEIGLSTRMSMMTMMMYPEDEPPHWPGLTEVLVSKESYYRVFGTTIGIGLTGLTDLHESFQMIIKKLVPEKDAEKGAIIDFIRPKTLFGGELTYPTLTGLPLTLDLQAVSFDSMRVKAVGVSDAMSLFSDFATSDLEFKLKLMLDWVTSLKGSVSLGANTPVHVGYQAEGRIDALDNIELEGIKKVENVLEMKINFPYDVISSRTVSFKTYGYKEVNGEGVHLATSTKDTTTVSDGTGTRKTCFVGWSISGLQFCQIISEGVEGSNSKEILRRMMFTIEKTNKEMTGYDIQLHSQLNTESLFKQSFALIATSQGSDVERKLMAKYSYENQGSQPGSFWESRDFQLEGVLGQDKRMVHLQFGTNDSETNEYSKLNYLKLETGKNKDGEGVWKTNELLNLRAEAEPMTFSVSAQFGGLSKSWLGTVKLDYDGESKDRGVWRGKLSIDKIFKWSGVSVDGTLNSFDNNSISLITKARIAGPREKTFELVQLYSPNITYEYSGDGDERRYERSDHNNVYTAAVYENGNRVMDIIIKHKGMWEVNVGHSDILHVQIQPHKRGLYSSPIILEWVTEKSHRMSKYNTSLTLIFEDRTQANFSYIQTDSVTVNGFVNQLAEFNGTGRDENGQLEISMFYKNFWFIEFSASVDATIKETADEVIENTKTVLRNRIGDVFLTSESNSVVDKTNRSLTILSNTFENGKLSAKYDFFGQIASDIFNGQSSAFSNLETRGNVYKGSIIERTVTTDDSFNSEFVVDINSPESEKPIQFVWNFFADSKNGNPDTLDSSFHLSSFKKIEGDWRGNTFVAEVVKDILWSKKKGIDFYTVDGTSNVSMNGEGVRESKFQMWMSGDPGESGSVGMSGFTQNRRFKDEFKTVILCNRNSESLFTQNVTFLVDHTDRSSGNGAERLVEGSVNKTIEYKNLMDFGATEVGEVIVMKSRRFSWAQVFRFHDKELTIFKEIAEEAQGDQKVERESIFLLHVSAKHVTENHQGKVFVKAQQNFAPCPSSNFNFTISK